MGGTWALYAPVAGFFGTTLSQSLPSLERKLSSPSLLDPASFLSTVSTGTTPVQHGKYQLSWTWQLFLERLLHTSHLSVFWDFYSIVLIMIITILFIIAVEKYTLMVWEPELQEKVPQEIKEWSSERFAVTGRAAWRHPPLLVAWPTSAPTSIPVQFATLLCLLIWYDTLSNMGRVGPSLGRHWRGDHRQRDDNFIHRSHLQHATRQVGGLLRLVLNSFASLLAG